MISRGDLYWVDLGPARGSRPAKRRPVLIVQADPYNASRLSTALAAVVTSNTSRADLPGNVFLPASATGLPRDSVVTVAALVTVDKRDLRERAGRVPAHVMLAVDDGLHRVLGL